jgi:hypothetical protein
VKWKTAPGRELFESNGVVSDASTTRHGGIAEVAGEGEGVGSSARATLADITAEITSAATVVRKQ